MGSWLMAKFEIIWFEDSSDEAVLEEIRGVASLHPERQRPKADFDMPGSFATC
jgi:hypothetical protein